MKASKEITLDTPFEGYGIDDIKAKSSNLQDSKIEMKTVMSYHDGKQGIFSKISDPKLNQKVEFFFKPYRRELSSNLNLNSSISK